MTRPAIDQLPCGRSALDVADRADTGRSTQHELGCPHCRAVIDAAGVTAAAAGELAALDVAVPAGLVPGVMRGVWAELRHTQDIPLDTVDGVASVTDRVVAAAAQRALDELADLVLHTCRVVPAGPGLVAVTLRAAAAYGSDLDRLAAAARQVVRGELRTQFGLAAGPVDVEFVDVFVAGGDR